MKCPYCKQFDFETIIQKCWGCGVEINKVNGQLELGLE